MDLVSAKQRLLVASLAGLLMLSACQTTPPNSPETEGVTNHMKDTIDTTSVTTDAEVTTAETPETEAATSAVTTDPTETEAPETEAETSPETETSPEAPAGKYDALVAFPGYSDEERAALLETAERMSGLRITYYADAEATQAVRSGVTEAAEAVFQADDGIRSAVLEGFITFKEDGAYNLSAPGAVNSDCISIIEGEHHVRAGARLGLRADAGVQYGVKLKLVRENDGVDQTISLSCNKGTEAYFLTVGRVLLEHEAVAVSPVLDIPMRDTYVCVGPDGYYYMTGTTGPDFWDNNYVIHIYRSADLSEWQDLGVVWDFREHATWAKDVSKEDRVPVWAPELSYINGNWYMTYSMGFWDGFCGGILVSTTGKPEGPYTDTTTEMLVDNIDGSLFTDDDGTVYYIYKDGLIAPLNEDLSGFAGDFKALLAADGLPVGFEGCSILKHNGKYYLTAATYNQSYDENGNLITTYDSMIAVSDSLMGPYSETRLLMRNGGHNNLFVDKEGNVWTTLFAPTGNLSFNCQPAIVRLAEDERGILTVAAQQQE